VTGRGKTIVIWVVSGLLALLYLTSGGMKLAGAQPAIESFTRYGYSAWFRLLIGAIEIVGAFLLLVPRTSGYAATALGVVMIGAAYTHLVNAEASRALLPVLLLVVLSVLAYARRPE